MELHHDIGAGGVFSRYVVNSSIFSTVSLYNRYRSYNLIDSVPFTEQNKPKSTKIHWKLVEKTLDSPSVVHFQVQHFTNMISSHRISYDTSKVTLRTVSRWVDRLNRSYLIGIRLVLVEQQCLPCWRWDSTVLPLFRHSIVRDLTINSSSHP